jgi:hypothetical protein
LEEDGSFKWGKKKEKRVNKESEPGFGRKGKEWLRWHWPSNSILAARKVRFFLGARLL